MKLQAPEGYEIRVRYSRTSETRSSAVIDLYRVFGDFTANKLAQRSIPLDGRSDQAIFAEAQGSAILMIKHELAAEGAKAAVERIFS